LLSACSYCDIGPSQVLDDGSGKPNRGLLGDNIETVKNNTETLTDASMEVGLKVNVEKTKYMLVSREQNAGQIRDIINRKQIICKSVTVEVFGNDSNKSKFDSGPN
jgi:hypothetical protein